MQLASNMMQALGWSRCGLGGMLICLLLVTPSGIHSWASQGSTWLSTSIPVYMILNLGSSWNGVASQALGEWSGAGSQFYFSSTTSSGSQTASCSLSQIDNRNVAVWRSTPCVGGNWRSGVLAITRTWARNGVIVDSDVIFDSNLQWSVYSGDLVPGKEDLRRVALHEFGHVLGLDHPDAHGQSQWALMNSDVSNIENLQVDDVAGVIAIYGRR